MRSAAVILMLAFFVSCSEKDHQPRETCLFSGKTSTILSQTSKYEWGKEVVLDDDKLVSGRMIDNTDVFTKWKRTRTIDYVPQYNADGFLTKMVVTTVDLYEGTKGYSYQYKNQHYLKFRTETTETSDYQYESGHATRVTSKTLVRLQGDNNAPVVEESETIKNYVYDSQNVIASALTTSSTGSVVSTFKNGIIYSETSRNAGGATTVEVLYDDKGQKKVMKGSNYLYEFTFDAQGNMRTVKFTQDGKPNYLQEYSYDDHVNPETHIPVKFKGIPENILTVVGTESVNNLIREKFTSYIGASNYDIETVYQYNTDGLPVSSAPKIIPEGETLSTTFRYKCP